MLWSLGLQKSKLLTIRIAIYNLKGGAGRTTVTINLAAALACQGASVLVCDLHGQSSLTQALGFTEAVYIGPTRSVYTYLTAKEGDPNRLIRPAPNDNFDVLPGDQRLYLADIMLESLRNREHRLAVLLNNLTKPYDYILVDCPPYLGVLSDNALVASHRLLVPARMQKSHLQNLLTLEEQIAHLEQKYKIVIGMLGIVPVGYLATAPERSCLADLEEEIPGCVAPCLRWRDAAIQDAHVHGHSIFSYKPAEARRLSALRESREDYIKLTKFIRQRIGEGKS